MVLGNNNHTFSARKSSWPMLGLKIGPSQLVIFLGVYLASLFIYPKIHPVRAEAPKEVINRVQRRYEMTNDLEAAFTQRATLKTLNETQLSSGKVYIKKPGKMRWDYLQPENQVVLLKDSILSVYTPEVNQLVEQAVPEIYRAESPTTFLAGRGKLKELFWVRVEPINGREEDATWRLVLIPKEENPQIKELRLEVSRITYDIVRSIIVDHFGNVTDIRYTKIRVNGGLDKKTFALKLPPGVQRVRPPSVPFK